MPTSATHCTMPAVPSVEIYYLCSYEDSAWLPDGEYVVLYQAYCPITNRPVGPRGGDLNPAYVRLWMTEKHPQAQECEIVRLTV